MNLRSIDMTEVYIHKSAEVSEKAKLGKGTKVWNGVQIRENVMIGQNCNIGKDVYIDREVIIGNNVKIQNGVSVYQGVVIEDDVFLGPHMTFTNDLFPRAFNKEWKIVPTKVEKGASIGANATIVCGVVIGQYSMVGAGTVITKDVKPYKLMAGNPAREIGNVCICGGPLREGQFCSACGNSLTEDAGHVY
jgi:UDP-2-acetamido-3-amino-2,3-dideoxy-glucuronate N-acetyltransferase